MEDFIENFAKGIRKTQSNNLGFNKNSPVPNDALKYLQNGIPYELSVDYDMSEFENKKVTVSFTVEVKGNE